MYQMQNQQEMQQLTYMASQLQYPQINISAHNPPFLVQHPTDPSLNEYMGFIIAGTAMEIQQNASLNPLRTFMYNQCRQGDFRSGDFCTLVNLVADNVLLTLYQTRSSPENVIPNVIRSTVELACAANIKQYPALIQLMPPETHQIINNHIYALNNLLSAIASMKQQMIGNNSPAMMNAIGGNISMPNRQFPNQIPNLRSSMGAPNGLFVNHNGPIQPSINANVQTTDEKYSRYTKNTIVPDKQTTPYIDHTVAVMPEIPNKLLENIEISASEVKWKPSDMYPYFPVYNPFKTTLVFTKDSNGNLIPKLRDKEKKVMNDGIMDYERHNVQTVFGNFINANTIDVIKHNKIMLDKSIGELNSLAHDLNNDVIDKATRHCHIKREIMCDQFSEETAWFVVDLEKAARQSLSSERVYAFRAYARIPSPLVSIIDYNDFVINLTLSETFIELREKLNNGINKSKITPTVWAICNDRVTNAINRALKSNLSLPNVSIDSFVTDIEDLLSYIERNFGKNIKQALLNNEKDIINASIQVMFDTVSQQIRTTHLEDYAEISNELIESDPIKFSTNTAINPSIIYLSADYSFTVLDVTVDELEIDLKKGIGCAVNESITPTVYNLVKGIFDDADGRKPIQVFTKHLIKTTDQRILEATRGFIGKDFYLLTLIK